MAAPPDLAFSVPPAPVAASPRLLEHLRHRIRAQHSSIRTEQSCAHWARRFIPFHGRRHSREMGGPRIPAFPTHLAVERGCGGVHAEPGQAAVLFPYEEVLQHSLPWLDEVVTAKARRRLPVGLTQREVRELLDAARRYSVADGLAALRRGHAHPGAAAARTCFRRATKFAPYRNCWVTATSAPP